MKKKVFRNDCDGVVVRLSRVVGSTKLLASHFLRVLVCLPPLLGEACLATSFFGRNLALFFACVYYGWLAMRFT